MSILGVYMTFTGPVEIGPDTSDEDLDRVAKCARIDASNDWVCSFDVMAAIAEARAMRGQKLMFKSVRAA